MSEEIIEIPVDVHLVRDPDGEITTTMAETNVQDMFQEVNRIWSPANIEFRRNSIEPLEINSEALVNIVGLPLRGKPSKSRIDLYYANNFDDWDKFPNSVINSTENGFSRRCFKLVCVRDVPRHPVTNERCLAHEFGHVLIGPAHPPDPLRLMASAQAGTNLEADEITIARNTAIQEFPQ